MFASTEGRVVATRSSKGGRETLQELIELGPYYASRGGEGVSMADEVGVLNFIQ